MPTVALQCAGGAVGCFSLSCCSWWGVGYGERAQSRNGVCALQIEATLLSAYPLALAK